MCGQLLQAQGGSKVLAILNPDSGPDYTKQDMSIFCVPQLFAAGVRTIGYVATTYSKRTLADVYQDVDLYFEQVSTALRLYLFNRKWPQHASIKVYCIGSAYVQFPILHY
jgi:hypothetical protein